MPAETNSYHGYEHPCGKDRDMPRTKKQIEVVVHMPLEKNKGEFQKQVNQVFVYSMKDNLGKADLTGKKKKEVVKKVGEVMGKATVLP